MKKIITHNGNFHADDCFAVATLQIIFEKNKENFKVIRTRDEKIIKDGDFVVDVGGVYDSDKNLFDHHQIGGAGERKNKIPYAAFGLVWKHFGENLCESKDVAERIDKNLVQAIDANDIGIDVSKVMFDEFHIYTITDVIDIFMPTWKESNIDKDVAFLNAVKMAKKILKREIKITSDYVEGEKQVIDVYNNTEDKRIIIFDKNYSGKRMLNKFKEPLFTIGPNADNDTWVVNTVRIDNNSFKNRKDLPESWAGKKGDELAQVSGVKDAIFCHTKKFIAVAKSKKGAIDLAKKALKV